MPKKGGMFEVQSFYNTLRGSRFYRYSLSLEEYMDDQGHTEGVVLCVDCGVRDNIDN